MLSKTIGFLTGFLLFLFLLLRQRPVEAHGGLEDPAVVAQVLQDALLLPHGSEGHGAVGARERIVVARGFAGPTLVQLI